MDAYIVEKDFLFHGEVLGKWIDMVNSEKYQEFLDENLLGHSEFADSETWRADALILKFVAEMGLKQYVSAAGTLAKIPSYTRRYWKFVILRTELYTGLREEQRAAYEDLVSTFVFECIRCTDSIEREKILRQILRFVEHNPEMKSFFEEHEDGHQVYVGAKFVCENGNRSMLELIHNLFPQIIADHAGMLLNTSVMHGSKECAQYLTESKLAGPQDLEGCVSHEYYVAMFRK